MEVIGITGPIASGKGELAEKLKSDGYAYIALSQFLKEEARKRGMLESRENLIALGNYLRAHCGGGILAKRALERIQASQQDKWVIDGIRHPEEISVLKNNLEKFTLIAITAPQEIRIKRALERAKTSDPSIQQELIKTDERDRAIGIDACIKSADFVINNENKTILDLHKELNGIIEKQVFSGTQKPEVSDVLVESKPEEKNFQITQTHRVCGTNGTSSVDPQNAQHFVGIENSKFSITKIAECDNFWDGKIRPKPEVLNPNFSITQIFPKTKRPSWDEYYLEIARAVLARGTCLRRNFGAVIVNHGQIISTGYTGAPRGTPNCIELGKCYREEKNIPSGTQYEKCRSVHAEENAMLHASREQMFGGTIYIAGQDAKTNNIVKAYPCDLCQRKIINSGLKQVVTMDADRNIISYSVEDWIKQANENPFRHLDEQNYTGS